MYGCIYRHFTTSVDWIERYLQVISKCVLQKQFLLTLLVGSGAFFKSYIIQHSTFAKYSPTAILAIEKLLTVNQPLTFTYIPVFSVAWSTDRDETVHLTSNELDRIKVMICPPSLPLSLSLSVCLSLSLLQFNPDHQSNTPHHKHSCVEVGSCCSPIIDSCNIRSRSQGRARGTSVFCYQLLTAQLSSHNAPFMEKQTFLLVNPVLNQFLQTENCLIFCLVFNWPVDSCHSKSLSDQSD